MKDSALPFLMLNEAPIGVSDVGALISRLVEWWNITVQHQPLPQQERLAQTTQELRVHDHGQASTSVSNEASRGENATTILFALVHRTEATIEREPK